MRSHGVPEIAPSLDMCEAQNFTLNWTFFLRARTEKACTKILGWFRKATGWELTVTERERYWRDPALYRVLATGSLEARDVASAVFEVLQRCHRAAAHWSVTGPIQYAAGAWQFGGYTVKPGISVVGLEMAEFILRSERTEHL
jgi:hypothetical protein